MKTAVALAGIAALTALPCLASTAAAEDGQSAGPDIVLDDIALRPGVAADIHVRVYENPQAPCKGKTILAIHGATGAATNFGPLAQEIFAAQQGKPVCKIAAVDMPGHGQSSFPEGMLFGDLTLQDYVTTVRSTFDRLDQMGIRPRTLMGHSQGGMVVQLVQQQLLDEGTNLRDELGVVHAVLMASVGPRGLPWAFVESGAAGPALSPFITFTPELGAHFALPPAYWPLLVFSTPTGTLAPNAPSPAEIEANGWASLEPLTTLGQLLGAPPFERPEVDAGAFAAGLGTKLDVVAFAADPIILPSESEQLYTHLTGEEDTSDGFTVVPGDDAVHGALINNPAAVLAAMQGRVTLP